MEKWFIDPKNNNTTSTLPSSYLCHLLVTAVLCLATGNLQFVYKPMLIYCIVTICAVFFLHVYKLILLTYLLLPFYFRAMLEVEGSIAIVKKFYFDFLMIFDSISLPHSKKKWFGKMCVCVCVCLTVV